MTPRVYRFDPLRDERWKLTQAASEVEFWLSCLALKNRSPRTQDSYLRTIAAFVVGCDKPVSEYTSQDIITALTRFPDRSRSVRRSHFSSFFSLMELHGKIDSNPMKRVPEIERGDQGIITVFSDAEIEALKHGTPDGVLMHVLLDTGIRKGDARRLQVKHCNLDRGTINILRSKGDKSRIIHMTPSLQQRLAEFFLVEGLNDDDYLWYCRPGGYKRVHDREVQESSFHKWWVRTLDNAGIPYRNPHTTRHTFATRARMKGLSIEVVSKTLGHASIKTTADLYVHLPSSLEAEEMHLLDL